MNTAGIGDVSSNEPGSGARYNAGKPDLSLIPISTLEDEARVWEYGKRKYVAWNWAKGMAWSIPLACALRHLAAWQRGEENDPESGLPHLAHAMCNLRMLTLYSRTYRAGDDRPVEWLSPREAVAAASVPAMSGWITWHGGECPVARDTVVSVRFGAGSAGATCEANMCRWDWITDGQGGDITAYRVVSHP